MAFSDIILNEILTFFIDSAPDYVILGKNLAQSSMLHSQRPFFCAILVFFMLLYLVKVLTNVNCWCHMFNYRFRWEMYGFTWFYPLKRRILAWNATIFFKKMTLYMKYDMKTVYLCSTKLTMVKTVIYDSSRSIFSKWMVKMAKIGAFTSKNACFLWEKSKTFWNLCEKLIKIFPFIHWDHIMMNRVKYGRFMADSGQILHPPIFRPLYISI